MIEVRKLDRLTREELRGLGHDGYVTDSKYKVSKEGMPGTDGYQD